MNKQTNKQVDIEKLSPKGLRQYLAGILEDITEQRSEIRDIQRTLNSCVRVVVFATIMVAWAVVNGGV